MIRSFRIAEVSFIVVVALTLFRSSAYAQAPASAPTCQPGQVVGIDTRGHCCWPGQAWSNTRQTCVGIPQCPAGTTPQGESCAPAGCPAGQAVGPDTEGHCCWPGQVWASSRGACVGIPQCPPGATAQGETCVASAAPYAPGAPVYPQGYPQAPPALPVGPQVGPPLPGTVPVHFTPREPTEHFTVEVTPPGAPVPMARCDAPCDLNLPPGRMRVNVTGAWHFRRDVDLRASPQSVRIERIHISQWVLGGVVTLLGVPAAIWGFANLGGHNDTVAGLAAGLGTGFAIGGVILLVSPNRNALDVMDPPTDDERRRERERGSASPGPRLRALGVGPAPGGAAVGALIEF